MTKSGLPAVRACSSSTIAGGGVVAEDAARAAREVEAWSRPASGRRMTSAGSAASASRSAGVISAGSSRTPNASAMRSPAAAATRNDPSAREDSSAHCRSSMATNTGRAALDCSSRSAAAANSAARPPTVAAATCSSGPPSARSTRGHGQYGGDSLAAHRPIATAKPRSSARRASASSRAVLPTPASPVTTTTDA